MADYTSLTENLRRAVQQASADVDRVPFITIEYWESIIVSVRRKLRIGRAQNRATLQRLLRELEGQLRRRAQDGIAA